MKRALLNGKVYVDRNTFHEAVLIDGDKIALTGSNEEVRLASGGCAAIDCGGKTVIPGFNDSHIHMHWTGEGLKAVNLLGATSVDEVIERGKAYEKGHEGPIIFGRGWNQDYFTDEQRFLTRHDLDRVSVDRPVIFDRACTHFLTCNTKALEVAGITKDTKQPDGGHFDIGEDGVPTGLFREMACDMIRAIIPKETLSDTEDTFLQAVKYVNSFGVTSVQSMDIRDENAEHMLKAIKNAYENERASVRLNQQFCFTNRGGLTAFLKGGYQTVKGDAMLRLGTFKTFLDGSLGARSALMRRDYADAPGERGIQCLSFEEAFAMLKIASSYGIQTVMHAIGDQAITMALDLYEFFSQGGSNPRRNGVVHCQVTDRTLLRRFKETGSLCLIQPNIIHYDIHMLESRMGVDMAKTSYAFNTLDQLGLHVSYGTDSPVESPNPFENIYCAVTRKDFAGWPEGGFYPDECVDLYHAIDNYTYEGAYLSFEENKKGRLLPGQYADLAVLSGDIFSVHPDEIKNLQCDMTILGGKTVFER